MEEAVQSLENHPQKTLAQKILHFPLTRIIIALFFVGLALAAAQLLQLLLITLFPNITEIPGDLFGMVVTVVAVHFAYIAYVRWIEKRPVTELSFAGFSSELGKGILIGVGFLTTVIGILWILGYYRVSGLNIWTVMLPIFVLAVISGYVEEVIIRGIIFRLVEEGLGTWIAVFISAALFGGLHMANPGATTMSFFAIAVTAGILLAAAYVLTRRLWMAVGIHFAWNFTQGGIFGVPVSGFEGKGLLNSTTEGPELITGGAFGAEASILTIVIGFLLGTYLLYRAYKAGHFIDPFWMARKRLKQTP